MQHVLKLLRHVDHLVIVVVGSVSCTAWVDYLMIHDTLSILLGTAPTATFMHGATEGFDHALRLTCEWSGFRLLLEEPELVNRVQVRSPTMLDGAALLVAYPRDMFEKGSVHTVDSADFRVIAFAWQIGVPILGVHRDGNTTWEGPT